MDSKLTEKKQLLGEKIVDTIDAAKVELTERVDEATGEKKVFVRGEFGRADKPTANKRLYPHKLWESQFNRLQEHVKSRKMLGELDHPSDGRTSLKRASHVITDLRLEGDLVVGEAQILDTSLGKDLKAMLKDSIPIGISSRGYGSTKSSNEGYDVVQEDYKLVTFDFVAEPADSTAYPNVFFEGAEIPLALREDEEAVVEDKNREKELEKKFAQKVLDDAAQASGSSDSVREEFKQDVLAGLAELKQTVRAELEQELLADPEVAGAKTALEAIKKVVRPYVLPVDAESLVSERDEEITQLKKQIAEKDLQLAEKDELVETLTSAAKEAGYKYYLEKTLVDVKDAAIVRKMVGDVTQYESTEAIREAVEAAASEIEDRREVEEADKSRAREAEDRLREEKDELAGALQETLEAVKQTQLLLYAERALTNHPKAEKIRRVLENSSLETEADVDDIVEGFRTNTRSPETLESVRDRVRNLTKGGRSELTESGDPARSMRRETNNNYNGLGVNLAELKKLSGMAGRGPN